MNSFSHRKPAGVALVIVLTFLVLITILIVGFVSSVSTELVSTKTGATAATTQQLANSAVNVVMAQLVDATKGQDSASALSWASQPGMIRTFDTAGKLRNCFKLYSSESMTVIGDGFKAANEVPPLDWNATANSELYTDLNAPVVNAAKELIYPIVDPNADGTVDPKAPTEKLQVDGFSLTSNPGFATGQPASSTNNRAPMPVKWLYMLKDGTLKAPSDPSKDGVKVGGATEANPIVGRVAFWTDDETTKVNINTASEGTYWDVPRVYTNEDFGRYSGTAVAVPGMAVCQPVRFEYQRYPGHPATTSLSPIFRSLPLMTVPLPSYPASPTNADASKLDPYYNLTPRIGLKTGGSGGSRGGSIQVNSSVAMPPLDTDRLYASVDELMFTTTLNNKDLRVPNTAAFTPAVPAAIATATTPGVPKIITKGVLEKARFFLTANSNAPETTLFNTPRIAVWPVWDLPAKRTAYDALLAFCSTIGSKPKSSEYYFTRANPRVGTGAASDYGSSSRNQQLYAYLQALTKADIPGFSGNFLQKYGAGLTGVTDRDQILTSIYDYIRCTNLQDQSNLPSGAKVLPYTPLFTGGGTTVPAGEVIPIRIGDTQGFGRFYSITSANLLFYGTKKDATNTKVVGMRAVFFLGFSSPMQGLACMRSNLKFKVVKGLEGFQAQGKNLNFKYEATKGNGTNYMDVSDLSLYHGRSVGGTESPWQAIQGKPFDNVDAGGDAPGKYPFFSSLDVDVTGRTDFAFTSSGDVTVEVRTKDTNQLLQTFTFAFPPGQFKVPTNVLKASDPSKAGFDSRVGGDYNSLVNSSDTVVALEVGGADLDSNPDPKLDATAGDIRMVASLPNVPSNRFRADNAYKTANVQFAHALVQSVGEPFTGAKYGKLANVSYAQTGSIARQPDVPSRAPNGVTRKDGVSEVPGVARVSGDWDTGFGDQKDGAYINKADEGDTSLVDSTNGQTRLPYSLGYGAGFASATNTYFSPNRQIPSPLMLGSIPTGVQRMLPWQTLLFHPHPEDTSHPGNVGPKDHLIADLFWMPVVEPYAISQPFATTGKINMNYQIMPFSYIIRSTGMYAVMKSTKFAALALGDSTVYKPLDVGGRSVAPAMQNRRQAINVDNTLKAFQDKFDNNEIFRSATQICEMNLVPANETNASMVAFWKNKYPFTGDNLREKPYVDLYPRLTTKSNTYTVHVRVQTLRKVPGMPADQWVAGKDKVMGEYRGSSILERYIDVNDPNLPDFADLFVKNPKDQKLNIDNYYRMRVVSTKRFAP